MASDDNDITMEDNEFNDDGFGDDDDAFGDGDDDAFGDGDDDFNDDEFGDDGDGNWSSDGDDDDNKNDDENPLSTLLNTDNSARKPIPQETKKAINDNVDEINMLPMFCGVPDLTAPAVMLGIKIKQFKGISSDQLAVWGLADYQYIGSLYTHK